MSEKAHCKKDLVSSGLWNSWDVFIMNNHPLLNIRYSYNAFVIIIKKKKNMGK